MIITRLVALFVVLGFASSQVHRDVGRARYEDFPHQVLLLMKYANKELGGGTGTLISDQWVLTAAHNIQRRADSGKPVAIEVSIPSEGFKAEANKWFAHGSYDLDRDMSSNGEYDLRAIDLALVKLSAPLMKGEERANVVPALLPQPKEEIEDLSVMRFAGYGDNDLEGEESVLLQGTSVKLPGYLSDHLVYDLEDDIAEHHTMANAVKIYNKFEVEISDEEKQRLNKRFENQLKPSHIFTGVEKPKDTGPYTGHGDSGCGLFKVGENTVYGVLSASVYEGYHSQQFTRPIIWVKVSNHVWWINNKIELHSDRNFGGQQAEVEWFDEWEEGWDEE